jgi:quercetin dioxygenase-like cupin family protein
MKIVHMGTATRTPATGDLFIGSVERQILVGEGDSQQVRVNVVTFKDGAVNKLHRHTFDQVLVITAGEGIVQVDGQREQRVSVGDVIFFPAGERHWHGAAPGHTMSHLTIATPGTTSMD